MTPATSTPETPGRGNSGNAGQGNSGNAGQGSSGNAGAGQSNRPDSQDSSTDEGPTARYVVRFVSGASPAAEAPGLQRDGARVERLVERVFPGAVVELSERALERLRRNPRVALVEPDMVVTTFNTQANPPWGLDRVDQRPLPLSNSFTSVAQGAGVRLYVVDTGVRADHVDFTGRVVAGTTTIADGQGTSDCNGHGTHVAGTAAGAVHGVAKQARIVPVRVLGCDGSGTLSGVIAGLDWILGQHPVGTPGVVNMSLGGGISSTLDAAVSRVISGGLVVVAAAGNSGTDACSTSPARVAAALTVGATSSNDTRASWSNFGTCLDVFAPGVSITSAWPSSPTATNAISGTSMAAPHVAGLVAVLWSQSSGSSAGQVQSRLVGDATPGVVGSAGSGSPNLLAYLTASDGTISTTTTTVATTTTTTTTIPTSTTTTTKPRRGNSDTNRGPKAREDDESDEDGADPGKPVVVPPGLATAAARIADAPVPPSVQERILERLVDVGERVLGEAVTSGAAIAALVVDTIERAPLPEPVRRQLVARVQAVEARLGESGEAVDTTVPPEELREVVQQFRNQRLVAATEQVNRVLERVATRLEALGDHPASNDLRDQLAELTDRVAGIADVADLRDLLADIRVLVVALAQALDDGDGS